MKNPVSFNRSWRDSASRREGAIWKGKLPVISIEDYLFAYANVTYDSTIVRSTDFEAVIPKTLGTARATDKPSDVISSDGYGAWSDIAEIEGPQGVKAFRPTSPTKGTTTEQLLDPKWQAPPQTSLRFRFFCTEPQTVILTAADHNTVELEIPASDAWQELTVAPDRLINRFSQGPMKEWSSVAKLQIQSKPGSDITKILFADFRWVK